MRQIRADEMVLDIIVLLILAFCMFFGWRNGFVYTFLHAVGWLLSLVMGFVWRRPMEDLIREHTGLYGAIHTAVSSRMEALGGGAIAREGVLSGLPDIIQNAVSSATSSLAESFAASLSDMFFSLTAFLIVVFGVKLVLWVIISLFSKKNSEGPIGFVDGVWGLLAGFLAGAIAVFVFLAILVPLPSLDPGLREPIENALADSYVAGDLYDNNLVILIAKTFLP